MPLLPLPIVLSVHPLSPLSITVVQNIGINVSEENAVITRKSPVRESTSVNHADRSDDTWLRSLRRLGNFRDESSEGKRVKDSRRRSDLQSSPRHIPDLYCSLAGITLRRASRRTRSMKHLNLDLSLRRHHHSVSWLSGIGRT